MAAYYIFLCRCSIHFQDSVKIESFFEIHQHFRNNMIDKMMTIVTKTLCYFAATLR